MRRWQGLSLFADCKRSTNVMSSWLVRAAASKEGGGGEGERLRVKRANEEACMEAGNANKRRSSEEERGEKSEKEEAKRNKEKRNEEGRRDETSGQETSDASRTKAEEEGGEGMVMVRERNEEDMSPIPREEQHRLGVPSLREKNDE